MTERIGCVASGIGAISGADDVQLGSNHRNRPERTEKLDQQGPKTRAGNRNRVKTGSALGLMDSAELVLPTFQFIEEGNRTSILEGLGKIIKLFDASKAGRWSALQFLLEQDPNLAMAPVQALRTGEVQQVVNAATAYLDVDED